MIRTARMAATFFIGLSLSACGIFGGSEEEKTFGPITTSIGVNGYLWSATLDTLSFMPIDNAYPSSAAIITDWFSTADAPEERVKVAVYFRSETLRSDGIRVNVVRQERQDGNWLTVPVQAATTLQIEEAILSRARALKIAAEG